jgi:hypothetical protein
MTVFKGLDHLDNAEHLHDMAAKEIVRDWSIVLDLVLKLYQ